MPGARGHVLEGAVAAVVEQPVLLGRTRQRPAVVGGAAGHEARLVRRHQEAVVVADEEIEPTVAVVVEERRGGAEPAIVDARRRGHVAEGAVAVVPEQLIRPQVGEVEVDPAVVVEVAGGDADAVPGGLDAGALGDVDEAERARAVGARLEVVAVEAVGEGRRRRRREDPFLGRRVVDRVALAEVDVEVAVVVVVEQRHRGAHHLG